MKLHNETWQLDLETNQVKWGGRMEAMHGYAPGTFGGTLADAVAHDHPEDRDQILQDISNHQAKVEKAYRVIHPNGRVRWIQGLGQTFLDDSGQPVQMHGVCLDVTEQKESEIALRQAEERFRVLATHAPVGILQTDTEGRCVFVNEEWCTIAGAKPEDALGEGGLEFLHPDDRQRCVEEWNRSRSEGRNYHAEYRLLNQQGGFHWVIGTAVPLLDASGTLTGYIGTVVDVTERKAAQDAARASEDKLREREERIRLAVESTNIGTFDFNPITGERNWSDRAKVMWGLSPDADVTNVSFLDRIHPEDRNRAEQAVQDALDPSGDGSYEVECRVVVPDQKVGWFIVKGQAFFEGEAANRRAIRLIGTVTDITDRKRAADALEAERDMLQHTIKFQDQERELIASEIHDGLVQYATGALMQLEALQANVPSTNETGQIGDVVGMYWPGRP